MSKTSDAQTFQYWNRRAKAIVATYRDHGFEPKKAAIFKKMDVIINRTKGTSGSIEDLNEFEELIDQLSVLATEPKLAIDAFWAEADKALSPDDINKIKPTLKPFEADVDNALKTMEQTKTQLAEMRAEFD